MNTMRKSVQILILLVCVFGCLLTAQAEFTTGSARGVGTDPNNDVVVGAKVTITKKSTNVATTVQTNELGQFEFINLPVGADYSVKVEGPSFQALGLTGGKV